MLPLASSWDEKKLRISQHLKNTTKVTDPFTKFNVRPASTIGIFSKNSISPAQGPHTGEYPVRDSRNEFQSPSRVHTQGES